MEPSLTDEASEDARANDEEIAAAANTGVPERSDGPGANLPTYVSQAEDGSLQLRMHVKLVTISDEGAVGWDIGDGGCWHCCCSCCGSVAVV